jgi:glyoxylase-like metal-dependent hydrolase (beta-lactamase superfamily II)
MKHFIYIFASFLLLISCEDFKKGYEKEMSEAMTKDSIASKPEVQLYVFNGGSILAKQKQMFSEGDLYTGETQELASPFYIIKHPNGVLLWDTGLPEGLVGQGDVTPEGDAFTISRKEKIVDQLASISLKPEDVDMIAFSHVHFDHTGAANNFPNAKWLVQQTEMDFINSDAIKDNGFYAPESFNKLTNGQIIDGDQDVFSDASVIIKYFPGHTAGHQALFLELRENGPTLLSGDTYHFKQNRADKVVPQFNYDIQESKQSIKKFEEFVAAMNAKVIIQHDPEDFKTSMGKNPIK